MNKIRIGISACLIGLKYRYDGNSSIHLELIEKLKDKVDFIPVCPEVECGLPVPRPKMRLEVSSRGTRIKVIDSGEDQTETMLQWAETKLEQLERRDIAAFIFKAKSPSCGLRTAKLFTNEGRLIHHHESGIFAKLFTRRFPDMIVGTDTNLDEFLAALKLELNIEY